MTIENKEREAFEKWARPSPNRGMDIRRNPENGEYWFNRTKGAWEAWQATRTLSTPEPVGEEAELNAFEQWIGEKYTHTFAGTQGKWRDFETTRIAREAWQARSALSAPVSLPSQEEIYMAIMNDYDPVSPAKAAMKAARAILALFQSKHKGV